VRRKRGRTASFRFRIELENWWWCHARVGGAVSTQLLAPYSTVTQRIEQAERSKVTNNPPHGAAPWPQRSHRKLQLVYGCIGTVMRLFMISCCI